jgi:RNA polymerase sigma factor (sigma-70 family)
MDLHTYLASNKRWSDLADDDLVQQAHIGDQSAFEILFERYRALLFLLISRIVRNEDLAHDVLQHVFLQLYRSLPTLVPGETLRAWLSQVARHRSIDELRRRRHLLFSEIEPFPDGVNTHSLPPFPTQTGSRRSRSNCTSYGSSSSRRLRRCPRTTAGSCCSAMPPNRATARLGRRLTSRKPRPKRTLTGRKSSCVPCWGRSLRTTEARRSYKRVSSIVM